jgi:hypothetical protein
MKQHFHGKTAIIIIIYLNCKWVYTRWQCTTIKHNTQITHHTQTITAHKATQTIKDTVYTMKHTTYNEYNYNATNTIKTTIKQININKK